MQDPLYLKMWLRGYSAIALPVYFRKLAATVPLSRLEPYARLRIVPISWSEPPLLEEDFEADRGLEELSSVVQEHLHGDSVYQVETRWDLWRWEEGEWRLKPSRLVLELFGELFDTESGEHVRVDFGPESLYLPESRSDQLRPVQSNIRSLLHLARDIEGALPVERRLLWSESDENFVDRLTSLLD